MKLNFFQAILDISNYSTLLHPYASGEGESLYLAETPVPTQLNADMQLGPSLTSLLHEGGMTAMTQAQMWMSNGPRPPVGSRPKKNPLHHDPYHNILTMLDGVKHFYAYSPLQRAYLYPHFPPGGHESSLMNDISEVGRWWCKLDPGLKADSFKL